MTVKGESQRIADRTLPPELRELDAVGDELSAPRRCLLSCAISLQGKRAEHRAEHVARGRKEPGRVGRLYLFENLRGYLVRPGFADELFFGLRRAAQEEKQQHGR